MTAIVHGWCGFVEKSNDVVFSQMLLNKMWLPDDMINEIKDYLYINKADAVRKYYRRLLNTSIQSVVTTSQICVDMFSRRRLTDWDIRCNSGVDNIHLQGTVCNVCGVGTTFHQRITAINDGVCTLVWDDVDYEIDSDGQHHIPIMKIGWTQLPYGTRGRFE